MKTTPGLSSYRTALREVALRRTELAFILDLLDNEPPETVVEAIDNIAKTYYDPATRRWSFPEILHARAISFEMAGIRRFGPDYVPVSLADILAAVQKRFPDYEA
jgi:hypothetical protein